MVEKTWALIKDNSVENIIVWDGVSDWSPPEGYILIETTNIDPAAGPGWTYVDGVFTPPAPPVIPEETQE